MESTSSAYTVSLLRFLGLCSWLWFFDCSHITWSCFLLVKLSFGHTMESNWSILSYHHWHGCSPCINPGAVFSSGWGTGVWGPFQAPRCMTLRGLLLQSNLCVGVKSQQGRGRGHCCSPWCRKRGTANPHAGPGTAASHPLPLGLGAQPLTLRRHGGSINFQLLYVTKWTS